MIVYMNVAVVEFMVSPKYTMIKDTVEIFINKTYQCRKYPDPVYGFVSVLNDQIPRCVQAGFK